MTPSITIHENSGFCFGVKNAVSLAEQSLESGRKTYCLGKIVHNPVELKRLSDKGLLYVNHEQYEELKGETILIRAHGEPPETFDTALKNGIDLINATCPIVSSLQNKIKKGADEAEIAGGQVLIYGKRDHPEVRALVGQSGDRARVISGIDDTGDIDLTRPLYIYSQTTMDPDLFDALISYLREKISQAGGNPDSQLNYFDSICRHVSHRKPELRAFASSYDLVLFVSGQESSNGKMLFEVCRLANERSFFVSHLSDLDNIDYKGIETIGVCGATSTPGWLLEDVAEAVKHKTNLTGQVE